MANAFAPVAPAVYLTLRRLVALLLRWAHHESLNGLPQGSAAHPGHSHDTTAFDD
jgi:hypothetical protein